MPGGRTTAGPIRLAETLTRLRALIREQHAAGERRLPPETVLSQQLGVGRSTLREALTRLEAEGAVARRRRMGTSITWGPASLRYPAGLILALSEFLRGRGVAYAVRERTARRLAASGPVATALGCVPGTEVFLVSRIYDIDGRPAAYLEHHLPAVVDGAAVPIERFQDTAVTFLEEIQGVRLHDVGSVITAEPADDIVAAALGVPPGAALTAMYTTFHDQRGRVVSLGRMVFRPDAVVLAVTAHDRLRLARR
jgi:GntR family transcriptional regulator